MTITTGVYERTIFRNEDNGYTVFSFKCRDEDLQDVKDDSGNIICCGYVSSFAAGMPVKIQGEKRISGDNKEFLINSINPYSDRESLTVDYLSSDSFKGVGPVTAKKIVDITGADIFSFVRKPDAISVMARELPEITTERMQKIFLNIENTTIEKEIFDLIAPFGGKFANAKKIYDKYGMDSIDALKNNPYEVGHIGTLSFAICDQIGKSLGFDKFSPERLKSLVYRVMQCNENAGNTYIALDEFKRILDSVCMQLAFKDKIPLTVLVPIISRSKNIKVLYMNDKLVLELSETWNAENGISENIKRLKNSQLNYPFNMSIIDDIEKDLHFSYSDEQKCVFNALSTSGPKILTGGPGTGKSTVINGLIKAYLLMHPNDKVVLCAPTGRAAQRMSEITGREAFTLHRLLEIKPYGDTVSYRDASNPIEANLIIVDEISMADTSLMSMLLGAIKNGATIIFSGDIDQLPSVGCGNVLKDMIDSNVIEVYRLTSIFRQKEGSNIVTAATAVRNGLCSIPSGTDLELIRLNNCDSISKMLTQYVDKYYDRSNAFKLQVLSTTKKGTGGTLYLNKIMQELLNPEDSLIESDSCLFKLGDKVMTIKNNYDAGYFNGDMGIIEDIDSSSIVVNINQEKIVVKKSDIKDLSLAYVSTVHKSQGNEHDIVIVVLPDNPGNMLQRNLLYTAITRARKKLIILSVKDSFERAIATTKICQRRTMLKDLLCKQQKALI